MRVRTWLVGIAAVLVAGSGCSPAGGTDDGLSDVSGAADGAGAFQRNHVLSDRAFTDTSLSAGDIQAMLEETPFQNARRSPFADYEYENMLFSELLHATAVAKGINPLVLLTIAHQKWSALGFPKEPLEDIAERLLYCACTDTTQAWCPERRYNDVEGRDSCYADLLRRYYATAGSIDDGNRPWVSDTGYGVGATHSRTGVTPVNRATVALYPVVVGRDATTQAVEEFHGWWHRFIDHYSEVLGRDLSAWLELPQNENFIGGPCETSSDCVFAVDHAQAQCIEGMCTIECPESHFCPDRPGAVTTFCVEMEGQSRPMCVSKCAGSGTCGSGFACAEGIGRAGQSDVTANVCMPDGSGAPDVTDPGLEEPRVEEPNGSDPGAEDPGAEDPGTQDPGTQPSQDFSRDVEFEVMAGSSQQGGYWVNIRDLDTGSTMERLPLQDRAYDRVVVETEPLMDQPDLADDQHGWDRWINEIAGSAAIDEQNAWPAHAMSCLGSDSSSASYDPRADGERLWVTPHLFFRHSFKDSFDASRSRGLREILLPMRITVRCYAPGSDQAEPCFD